jgi:hypothetical protein
MEFYASMPRYCSLNVSFYYITSQDARHGETSGDIEAQSGADIPNLDNDDIYPFTMQNTPTGFHDLRNWYITQ